MAIFAIVKNKKVVNIAEADNKTALELLLPGSEVILETTATGFAWIGSKVVGGKFTPPQPYDSWTLDTSTLTWSAPIEMPSDGKEYFWAEDLKSWVVIELPPKDLKA